jgi:hypothetical protein
MAAARIAARIATAARFAAAALLTTAALLTAAALFTTTARLTAAAVVVAAEQAEERMRAIGRAEHQGDAQGREGKTSVHGEGLLK